MKVICITNLGGKYYGHYLFEQLCQKYPDIQMNIYFCAYSEKNRYYKIEIPKSNWYKIHHLQGEISWGIDKHFNFGIIPLIFRNKSDIYLIGGYSYLTVVLAIILSRILKRKYILSIDHMYKKQGGKGWFRNLIKRFLIKGANAYITTSEESKDNLMYYGALKDRIFIAPLSCPDFFYKDNIKNKDSFIKPFEKYILFVGRFEEYKGIRDLLRAFTIIKSKFSDIGLVLIGSGSLEQDIDNFIKDNKLNDSVRVYNWLPYEELPLYYRNALIFICPSTHELWALVVNEAMASGLPVIASGAVGAARALIQDGKNGFIVKPNNSEEIAIKIENLLKNSDLRRQISRNAYETQKQYTIDKISDIYYQVFNFVLNQNA